MKPFAPALLLLLFMGSLMAQSEKPLNFIVILADDIGAHELSLYGHPQHRTPNIDKLGQDGIWFETGYTTPICHSTRFQIMTGQYAHHNGVYHFPGRPGGPNPEQDNIASKLTFGQMFKSAGYATAHAGKWQLTGKIPDLIHETGFDSYCMWAYTQNLPTGVEHQGGWEGGKKTSRYWHPSIVKNGEYVPTQPDSYGPDMFTDFVIDFATQHKDEPFFIYYPMALTHSPYYPTPPMNPEEKDKFKHSKANWQANVEYMDALVGRITQSITDLGIRDNTVILFTGDNGTGGNGKGDTTEMGSRVPFVVNCPGLIQPTGKSRELVDHSDIVPTLNELAGIKLPEDHIIDGHSFAPLLKGEAFEPREWIYSYLGGQRVIRTKRWLLENNSPKDFGQLYDCGESRDGSGYVEVTDSQDPEVLAAKELMKEILKDKPVPDVSTKAKPGKDAPKKKAKA